MLGRRNPARAVHIIDRNCRYRARLVVKDLHDLGVVGHIEILLGAFVVRASQLLAGFVGGHAYAYAAEIAEGRTILGFLKGRSPGSLRTRSAWRNRDQRKRPDNKNTQFAKPTLQVAGGYEKHLFLLQFMAALDARG